MKFKDWLNETMTSTNCIAGFSRIALPLVTRQWPPAVAADLMAGDDGKKKKKKKVKQPQVEESHLFLNWLKNRNSLVEDKGVDN